MIINSKINSNQSVSQSSQSLKKQPSSMISIPDNRNVVSTRQFAQNMSNSLINDEKNLFKWRIKMEEIKSKSGASTFNFILTGEYTYIYFIFILYLVLVNDFLVKYYKSKYY